MVISEALPLLMEPLVINLTRTEEGFTFQWDKYDFFLKIMKDDKSPEVVIKNTGEKT